MAVCPHPPYDTGNGPHDETEPRVAGGVLCYNCLLPGNKIQGRFLGGSEAWYTGEAIELATERGLSVRVTPKPADMTTSDHADRSLESLDLVNVDKSS